MDRVTILDFIKSVPVLGYVLVGMNRKLYNFRRKRFAAKRKKKAQAYSLIDPFRLPIYAPNSSGAVSLKMKLTTLAVNQTIPLMNILLREFRNDEEPQIYSIDAFCEAIGVFETKILSEGLAEKFNEYGSDKSTTHNYHLLYAALLKQRHEITGLLEIGLGTNNSKFASNMGRYGQPGASLRAFRDYLPNAIVYGADIDKDILFEDDRIRTFFVDQTDMESYDLLHDSITSKLDLIIDDGLHAPNANLATLIFGLRKMNDNKRGIIVIEDIPERAIPFWKMLTRLIPDHLYDTYIVKTHAAYVFVCSKVN